MFILKGLSSLCESAWIERIAANFEWQRCHSAGDFTCRLSCWNWDRETEAGTPVGSESVGNVPSVPEFRPAKTKRNRSGATCGDADACSKGRTASPAEGPAWPATLLIGLGEINTLGPTAAPAAGGSPF